MDILFIGGVYDQKKEQELLKKSKAAIDNAANSLQWNIINGIDECNNKMITIASSVCIGSFPKYYKDIYVRSLNWEHKKNAKDKMIGFLNLYGIKQIWRAISLSEVTTVWADNKNSTEKAIIVYSMQTPLLYAAMKAKKVNASIKVCLICPDIPEFLSLSSKESILTKILKRIDNYILNQLLSYIDSFVLITKEMRNKVKIKNKPYIVIEGMINPQEYLVKKESHTKEKILLYSGTLQKAYGIQNLLEAFTEIPDKNMRLWICGEGEVKEEVIKYAENDKRIVYYGQISRNEVLNLQRRADLLVNPRNESGDYTKYSFPSKILEYMMSGTPVLMYKLPGIPVEYYRYAYTVEKDGKDELLKSIVRICSLDKDKLMKKGKDAQLFVLQNKNNYVQSRKIFNLLKEEKV